MGGRNRAAAETAREVSPIPGPLVGSADAGHHAMPMRPPPDEREQRLERLGAALDAFLSFQRGEGGGPDDLLVAHPGLRDLLEPMLADAAAGPAAPPAPVDPAPGRVFGDYRLLHELGRGGTGVVFEAEQISLGRRVALKLLHGHLAIAPAAIERFRSEAAAVARLRHPGLVPVYEVGEVAGHHFFTMELVAGRPLDQLVRNERLGIRADLSRAAECAELVARIGDVLQHAHEHGLVHRDVKPHNVLVGDDGTVRLLDFGLAKHVDPAARSITAEFLGTPHYMAPEQIAGTGRAGPRSDVYSLGIVLYELLARQRPFDGGTTRDVLASIVAGAPPPLARAAPRTPPDLATICHKAIEADPADRYASAGAMADDLRRFLRIEPILAQPPGAFARAAKWVRRHRVRVAIVALGAALAIGAPAAWLVQEARTSEAVARERERLVRADDLAFRGIEDLLALLGDSLARLPDLPSGAPQFARVVAQCESYLALSEGDPTRWLRVAAAYSALAGIHQELGDLAAASAAVERALELAARSGTGVRTPPQLALEGRLLRRRLHLRQVQGLDDARTFEQAIAPWQELMQQPATDPVASVELASTLVVRARALAELQSSRGEAEQLLRRALQLLPEPSLRTELAELVALRANVALGQVALWNGDRATAEAVLGAAAAAAEARATDVRFGAEMALALTSKGELQHKSGRSDEAERSLRRAIGVLQPLLLRYPGAATLQRTRLWSGTQLAGQLLLRGKAGAAEAALRAAATELGEPALAELGERSWMDRSVVAGFDVQLANCLMMHGDGTEHAGEAGQRLDRAVALLEQLVAEQPAEPDFRVRLGGALHNLAALANQQGQFAAGAAHARAAIAEQTAALAARPDDTRARQFLGMHHGQLAFSLARTGEHQAALDAARQGVEHAGRHAATLRLCAEAAALVSVDQRSGDPARAEASERSAAEWVALLGNRDTAAARRLLRDERFAFLRARPELAPLLQQGDGR